MDKLDCSAADKGGVVEMRKWRCEDIWRKILHYSEIPALDYATSINK